MNDQIFFFVVSESLNDVDKAVTGVLSKQYPVWRAYPEEDTWYFQNGETRLDLGQFLSEYHLQEPRDTRAADEKTRDYVRQIKCVSFFEAHGILKKIAIERNFANFFLTNCFDSLVNIDYIIQKRNGQLCAIEVKFKNESSNGTFGINAGQLRMFGLLEQLGFEIQHWILYKGANNKKNISIFDFLEQKRKKWWRFGVICPSDVEGNGKTAPKETSVNGFKVQEYYEFDASNFKFKAPLDVSLD